VVARDHHQRCLPLAYAGSAPPLSHPFSRDLAAGWTDPAWTDHKPPQHVRHEPYADEDEEYLYRSEAHSHIMHRPGLSRKRGR
jgi:hypothetical protein